MPGDAAASRGFHSVENSFPLCGKVPETCFHCVEDFPKHVSIVWKNRRNMVPLCGKPDGRAGRRGLEKGGENKKGGAAGKPRLPRGTRGQRGLGRRKKRE